MPFLSLRRKDSPRLWRLFAMTALLSMLFFPLQQAHAALDINSTCCERAAFLRNQPTISNEAVDIFTAVILGSGSTSSGVESKFYRDGDYWLSLRQTTLLTQKKLRVHVLTDSADVASKGLELGFHMHKLDISVSTPFYEAYVPNHLGGNKTRDIWDGYFAFYRWIKYAEIVQMWNKENKASPSLQIKNIMAMDAQLMFLVNPHNFFFRALNSVGYKSVEETDFLVVIPGTLQLFSSSGLTAYSKYISSYFHQPVGKIHNATKAMAYEINGTMHFTDVLLAIPFAYEKEEQRNLCFNYLQPSTENVLHSMRVEVPRCTSAGLQCAATGKYRPVITKNVATMIVDGPFIYAGTSPNNKFPLCFMRFEDAEAHNVMPIYATYMINQQQQSLSGTQGYPADTVHTRAPMWLQNKTDSAQYVVKGKNGKNMFFITKGTRYRIAPSEVFDEKGLGLKEADVFYDFPDVVVNAMPQKSLCCDKTTTVLLSKAERATQAEEVVDIFTSVIVENATDIPNANNMQKYIESGQFWLTLKYTAVLNTRKVRIHILTDSIDVHKKGMEMGFYMHMYYPDEENEFYKVYKKHHIGFHYDEFVWKGFFKLFRWTRYSEIVQEWNVKYSSSSSSSSDASSMSIKNIMAVDIDTLMLTNPHKFFFKALHTLGYVSSADFEMVVVSPGSFLLLSPPGLETYATFLNTWYTNQTEHAVNWLIEYYAPQHYGKQFSDVQLGVLFANQKERSRSLCFHWDKYSTGKVVQLERAQIDRCMIEKMECVPGVNYVDPNLPDEVGQLRIDGQHIYYGKNEEFPLCFLHFPSERTIIKHYATYLLSLDPSVNSTLRGGVESASSTAVAAATTTISSSSSSSSSSASSVVLNADPPWFDSIYSTQHTIKGSVSPNMYVARRGKLHWISTGEIFEAMNLKLDRVVYNYPDVLSNALAPGAPINTETIGRLCTSTLVCKDYIPSQCCNAAAAISESVAATEVVDIFTDVMVDYLLNTAESAAYVTDGDFWLTLRYNLMLAKSGSVRLHILTDSLDIANQGESAGFNTHIVERSELETFLKLYAPNHRSIDGDRPQLILGQAMKMFRYIKYGEIVHKWNGDSKTGAGAVAPIKNVMTVDSELLFVSNPHVLYFKIVQSMGFASSADFDVIIVSPGSLELFSTEGLTAYAKYIVDFYSRSFQAIEADVENWGEVARKMVHFTHLQLGISFAAAPAITAATTKGGNPAASKLALRRPLCFQYDRPPTERAIQLHRKEINPCIIEQLGCRPTHEFSFIAADTETLRLEGQAVYRNKDAKYPECFINFQGGSVHKRILKASALSLLHRLTALQQQQQELPPASITPQWLDSLMNDQQLVMRDNTFAKLYISKSGSRYYLAGGGAFDKMLLKDSDIISGVPDALIQGMKAGTDVHGDNVAQMCKDVFKCVPVSGPCCQKKIEPTERASAVTQEVVDVFVSIFSSATGSEFKYAQNGDVWLAMRYNILLTKKGSVRLHIVTDSSEIYDLGNSAGFSMYKMASNETFHKLYSPFQGGSYNDFYKWIKYAQIVHAWNKEHSGSSATQIRNVLTIDSDVLFMVNPHKFFFRALHSLGYESSADFDMSSVTSSGSIQMFSATGLAAYSTFIIDFFSRSPTDIGKQVNRIGGNLFGRPMLPDNHLGIMFAAQNENRRSQCFRHDPSLDGVFRTGRLSIDPCMKERLECAPTDSYALFEEQIDSLSFNNRMFHTAQEKLPQCFMHFQHPKSRHMVKVYSLWLLYALSKLPEHQHQASSTSAGIITTTSSDGRDASGKHHQHSGHSAPSVYITKLMNQPLLLLNPKRTKQYLFSKGVIYPIKIDDIVAVVTKLGLKTEDTVYDCSEAVLRQMPSGAEQLGMSNLGTLCSEGAIACPSGVK